MHLRNILDVSIKCLLKAVLLCSDLEDNMHIEVIPSNAFVGLSSGTITEL